MKPTVYKVVFEGDVLPGFGQLDVQKKLAELFAIDVKIAARLFMGKQLELKRGVSVEDAKKHMRALARIGALTYILPDERDMDMTDSRFDLENSGRFDMIEMDQRDEPEEDPDATMEAAFTAYFESREKRDLTTTDSKFLVRDPDEMTNPPVPESDYQNTDVNRVQQMQRLTRQILESID